MKGFRYLGETQILNDNLRASASGNFKEVSGGMTHYELDGPENGQTVVLIHGFSIPFQIWDTAFNPLVDAGYRVLRYDLFGRGYSDRPPEVYNQDLFDQQLLDLLYAIEIDLPVDLIGLSMGGAISVVFCDRHPELVRKLVLIDPSGFPLDMPIWTNLIKAPFLGELVMSLFGERFLISSMGKSQGTPLLAAPLLAAGGNGPASPAYGCVKPRLAFSLESPLDESGGQAREIKLKSFPSEARGRFTAEGFYDAEQYPEYVEVARQQMKIVGYRRALLSTLRHDMLTDLSEIYQKVGKQGRSSCLIWGVQDKIIPFEISELVRKAIPGIVFHPIEGAGHVPHYERPEVVLPFLIDYLGDVN